MISKHYGKFTLGGTVKNQGPSIEELTRRLAECPVDFLDAPKQGGIGKVSVDAVVSDLLLDCGGGVLSSKDRKQFTQRGANHRNYLRQVLVSCWLFHAPCFTEKGNLAAKVKTFLKSGLEDLSRLVAADLLVQDPDRREELVRLALAALNLLPLGETKAQASDRLKALDSVERERVISETRAQQERARQIREAMARKKAQEAAARYSRE